MKNFLIAVLSASLLFSLTVLWLNNNSKKCLEKGVLGPQVDRLIKHWTDSGTAPENRQVDIVISDALAGIEAESSDGEILSSALPPTFFQKLARFLFRKSLSAPEEAGLAKALSGRPNAVTWTHKGQESVSEEEMAKEIMRAGMKAAAARASINIITEGFAAAPALKAISALKTVKPNGKTPAVDKLICFNMNRPTLAKINPGVFRGYKKPENIKEWINIWAEPGPRKIRIMELHDENHNILRYTGKDIFLPEVLYRGIGLKDWTDLLNNLLNARSTIAYLFDYNSRFVAAKVAEEKEKIEEAKKTEDGTKNIALKSRDLKGRTYDKQLDPKIVAQPANPIDMIGGLSDGKGNKSEGTEKKKKIQRG